MGSCGSKKVSSTRGSEAIEIAQLRKENESLRKDLEAQTVREVSYLDLTRLDDHVEMYLNSDANNSWVPDSVEGQAIKTIYVTALGSVKSVVESTRVEFLGHEVRMVLQPTKKE